MPLIEYVPRQFSPKSLKLIEQANEIIADYQEQGFSLTLRQLYYQFVSKDLIENTQRSYKNIGSVINDGRLAGLIDWNAIEDRTRSLRGNSHWDTPSDIMQSCIDSYAIDKWSNQEFRIEVWIEKDALVGVVEKICRKLDVPFFSCRGYTSQSEMWVASQRLIRHRQANPQRKTEGGFLRQEVRIIHLGDHDPSGKDMTRDIADRLALFTENDPGIEVERIALTMEQIRELKPPPNPAKLTDARAKEYIREFGTKSWELDALDPAYLMRLINKTVSEFRDNKRWKSAVAVETEHRDQLESARDRMD